MYVVRLVGKGKKILYGSTVHSSFIRHSQCSKSVLIIEFLVTPIYTEYNKDIRAKNYVHFYIKRTFAIETTNVCRFGILDN